MSEPRAGLVDVHTFGDRERLGAFVRVWETDGGRWACDRYVVRGMARSLHAARDRKTYHDTFELAKRAATLFLAPREARAMRRTAS